MEGDSGVGKTRLCQVLSGAANITPEWTIGCNTFIFSHNYKGKDYDIECVDIGGSEMYSSARKLFYQEMDG